MSDCLLAYLVPEKEPCAYLQTIAPCGTLSVTWEGVGAYAAWALIMPPREPGSCRDVSGALRPHSGERSDKTTTWTCHSCWFDFLSVLTKLSEDGGLSFAPGSRAWPVEALHKY